jgi:hypothetical protein
MQLRVDWYLASIPTGIKILTHLNQIVNHLLFNHFI